MLHAIISWLKRLFGEPTLPHDEVAHIGYEAAPVEQELIKGWIKDEPDARDQVYGGRPDGVKMEQQ